MAHKHKCLDCENLSRGKRCRKCHFKTRIKRPGSLKSYRRYWMMGKKYGIGEGDFEAVYQAFKGRCGICGTPLLRETKGKSTKNRACLDHDHKTGNIRGILCHNCNSGLGLFKDDVKLLEKAKEYLII